MRSILCAAALVLTLCLPISAQSAPPAHAAPAPLGPAERAALETAARPGLEDLRAAAYGPGGGLDASERALLREAASRHPELVELRAGDLNLSDREVKIILITAGIVIVIALIL
jgi:hypothetical protein